MFGRAFLYIKNKSSTGFYTTVGIGRRYVEDHINSLRRKNGWKLVQWIKIKLA
jgi:hypothetical protein